MNHYGVILDDLGFSHVLQELIGYCVDPLSRILYPHVYDTDRTPLSNVARNDPTHNDEEEKKNKKEKEEEEEEQDEDEKRKDSKTTLHEEEEENEDHTKHTISSRVEEQGSLDSHHGFLVEYEIGKDTKLAVHIGKYICFCFVLFCLVQNPLACLRTVLNI